MRHEAFRSAGASWLAAQEELKNVEGVDGTWKSRDAARLEELETAEEELIKVAGSRGGSEAGGSAAGDEAGDGRR